MMDCRERCHVPTWCYSLYDYMVAVSESRAVAKRNGTEKKNYRATDEFKLYPTRAGLVCGGCSDDAIRRMVKELVRTGWLVVVKESARGRDGEGIYRVIRHKEWCERHGLRKCIRFKFDRVTGEQIAY